MLRELANLAVVMKEEQIGFIPEAEGYKVVIAPPSNIERMVVRIPADRIEGYAVTEPFALSSERLAKILATCGDTLEMDITDRVVIRSGRMKCTMPMIDMGEIPKVPTLTDFTSECVVPSNLVRQISDAAPDGAQAVRFILTEEGLTMRSDSGGVDETEMTVPADECVMCEGESKNMFMWEAWRTFLKGVPRGMDLDMRMANNYPLIVRFETENGLSGEWMLAPWIEQEE